MLQTYLYENESSNTNSNKLQCKSTCLLLLKNQIAAKFKKLGRRVDKAVSINQAGDR